MNRTRLLRGQRANTAPGLLLLELDSLDAELTDDELTLLDDTELDDSELTLEEETELTSEAEDALDGLLLEEDTKLAEDELRLLDGEELDDTSSASGMYRGGLTRRRLRSVLR